MRDTYGERDRVRGPDATFRWLTEEVGELARALRKDERDNLELEFSDVLAWLASLANLQDVDLDVVDAPLRDGCPKCGPALPVRVLMDRVQVPQEHHREPDRGGPGHLDELPDRAREAASAEVLVLEDTPGRASEDGRVVATAAEFRFHQWFGGEPLGCSGIWGVTTLPEHRSQGLATACVESLLRAARDRGDPLTALFPAVLRDRTARLGYELAGAFVRASGPAGGHPRRRVSGLRAVTLADADRDVAGVRAAYPRVGAPAHRGPWSPPTTPSGADRDVRTRRRRFDARGRRVRRRPDHRLRVLLPASTTRGCSTSRSACPATCCSRPRDRHGRLCCAYFRGFRGAGQVAAVGGTADGRDARSQPWIRSSSGRSATTGCCGCSTSPTAFEDAGLPAVEATATIAVDDPLLPAERRALADRGARGHGDGEPRGRRTPARSRSAP